MIALYLLRPVGHEVNVHVALGKKNCPFAHKNFVIDHYHDAVFPWKI